MKSLIYTFSVVVLAASTSFAGSNKKLDLSAELNSTSQELQTSEKAVQKQMTASGVVLDTRITRPSKRDLASQQQNVIVDSAGETQITTKEVFGSSSKAVAPEKLEDRSLERLLEEIEKGS